MTSADPPTLKEQIDQACTVQAMTNTRLASQLGSYLGRMPAGCPTHAWAIRTACEALWTGNEISMHVEAWLVNLMKNAARLVGADADALSLLAEQALARLFPIDDAPEDEALRAEINALEPAA
ncbi:MAG: hypothetical protein RhofKO_25540 [Rhodothermales bacterium]